MDEQGFVEGVSKASPAALSGKDELGLSANLAGFRPASNGTVEKRLLGYTAFESERKIPGAFVTLDEGTKDFMVGVWVPVTASVLKPVLLWVVHDDEERTFTRPDGTEVTYRPKRLSGLKPFEDEADLRAELAEIRENLDIALFRHEGGWGAVFSEALADDDEDEASAEEAIEALMGAESVPETFASRRRRAREATEG